MKSLNVFFAYNGEGEFYQSVSNEICEKYANFSPKYFIEILKKKGLLHFRDRFLWMVNPDDYSELISLFRPNEPDLIVFMRTAFGGLFYYQSNSTRGKEQELKGDFFYHCPIFNKTTYMADALDAVMNGWLTTKEVYNPLTYFYIYEQACQKLPAINPDECFGFVPAIALGGDLDAENLKVFKLKEHLSFLSQL